MVSKNGAVEMFFLTWKDSHRVLISGGKKNRLTIICSNYMNKECNNKLDVIICENHKDEHFSKY